MKTASIVNDLNLKVVSNLKQNHKVPILNYKFVSFFLAGPTNLQINKVRLTIRDNFASGGYGFSVKICDQAKSECCVVFFGDMYKGDSFVRSAIDDCHNVEVTQISTPTVIIEYGKFQLL